MLAITCRKITSAKIPCYPPILFKYLINLPCPNNVHWFAPLTFFLDFSGLRQGSSPFAFVKTAAIIVYVKAKGYVIHWQKKVSGQNYSDKFFKTNLLLNRLIVTANRWRYPHNLACIGRLTVFVWRQINNQGSAFWSSNQRFCFPFSWHPKICYLRCMGPFNPEGLTPRTVPDGPTSLLDRAPLNIRTWWCGWLHATCDCAVSEGSRV